MGTASGDAVVPLANDAGIHTQSAQDITFPTLDEFHFLSKCRGVGPFP